MYVLMKIPLIQIGNSRGIRIPKALLEQVGFSEEVELSVHKKQLVLSSAQAVREGWETAFQGMTAHGDDQLLDPAANEYLEWEW